MIIHSAYFNQCVRGRLVAAPHETVEIYFDAEMGHFDFHFRIFAPRPEVISGWACHNVADEGAG